MATLYQSGAVWNIKYCWRGKRYSRSLRTKDRSEAERRKAAFEVELAKLNVEVVEEHIQGYLGTVGELVDRYKVHVESSHRGEWKKVILRVLDITQSFYGQSLVKEFGPKKLKSLREHWVESGNKRSTCNRFAGIVRAMFAWGVEEELVNVKVYQALTCVKGLQAGRTKAPESQSQQVVSRSDIFAVAEVLPRTLKTMVLLQYWSGARPGELFNLTPGDVDTSGDIWIATIHEHKNKWRENGKPRFLVIPKTAQAGLRELLLETESSEPLFQPIRAMKERWAACKTHRKEPSSGKYNNIHPTYDKHSYRRAISRACEKAGVTRFTPYQLRHTAATEIEKQSGAQAARAALGHSTLNTTQIYLHADIEAAIEAARHRK